VRKTAENRRGDDAVAVANPMARRHRREVGRIRHTRPEARVWTLTPVRLGTCERQRIQGTSSLPSCLEPVEHPDSDDGRSTIPRSPTVGLARLGSLGASMTPATPAGPNWRYFIAWADRLLK
jgi:hypothetical protein